MKRLLLALALLLLPASAQAAYDYDIVGACETTTTTGTGTVDLAGAYTTSGIEYVAIGSQISSGDTFEYSIEASNGKWEHGRATFTDAAPDTVSRTARWSSDGSGVALTLPAGTHIVCARWGPGTFIDGVAALDIASIDASGLTGLGSIDATTETTLEGALDLADLQGDLALGTQTSGNYAAGDAEAGAALTGDSATAFFSAGTIEDARIDGSAEADEVLNSDKGDFTCTTGTCALDADVVADSELSDTFTIIESEGISSNDNDTSIPTSAAVKDYADTNDADTTYTLVRQVRTATGTYTPTSGAVSFFVRCQAAGGGGGGSDNGDSTTIAKPADGGGGGQYAEISYDATEMGANASVTIGAVGAAGSTSGGAGGTATDSSFNPAGTGGTLTVDGGYAGGGTGASATTGYFYNWTPGAGGSVASGGDFEVDGASGTDGYATPQDGGDTKTTWCAGFGGDAFLGKGSRGNCMAPDVSTTDVAGDTGQSYGGGGGGAVDNDTTGSAGGAGGPAICIIDELVEG